MEKDPDNVSNIHKRFSLTLINPSSYYFSLVVSLAISVIISLTVYIGYLSESSMEEVWYRIPLVVAVLAVSQIIDRGFSKKRSTLNHCTPRCLETCCGWLHC